jgi:hypothetical protein
MVNTPMEGFSTKILVFILEETEDAVVGHDFVKYNVTFDAS